MKKHYDIAIVGAGPAGMAAAVTATQGGASTLILDEQPTPGGQIYRSIEQPGITDRDILGPDYYRGEASTQALRRGGADYVAGATVWQVTPTKQIGVSVDGKAHMLAATQVILATGAQERPVPVPGWTLPGVATAGAAQILLKTSGLAAKDSVFIGSGPLLYLVARQYIAAGVRIKAVLDTTPHSNYWRTLPHWRGGLSGLEHLLKGRRWIAAIKQAGVALVKGVEAVKLEGDKAVRAVTYRTGKTWHRLNSEHVFLHQGVVPNINLTQSLRCKHRWCPTQWCWQPVTDRWGVTSIADIAIAGDGITIGGAPAADRRGSLAAIGALHRLGRLDGGRRDRLAKPHQKALRAELRLRPFLDTLFRPARQFRVPADNTTIVCRCEEVSAGCLREMVAIGCAGPNQLKGFSRCGMGPCQGRLCGLTVAELIAGERNMTMEEVGYYRLRPPIKPVSIGELAQLNAK